MPREKLNQDRQERLLDELEDIVSLLAQQTDSKTTNLQVNLEQQRKQLEEQDSRRWKWFVIIASSVLIAIGVITFEMWERQYDRINTAEKQIVKMEASLEVLKDGTLKKYEFREQLEDYKKKTAEDRDKKDKEMEDRVKLLEEHALQRKK